MEAGRCYATLWVETVKPARNADIDRLELRNGGVHHYDLAVNAVINVLKNDISRPSNWCKKIPVTLKGAIPLSDGARRMLEDTFKSVQQEG